MSKLVYILNGPNLNMLGRRQPEIYGAGTLADLEADCDRLAAELGLKTRCLQSNSEGQLVDWIQQACEDGCSIIINAGAYSHTSIAILDALNIFEGPVMEVHISDIRAREDFRHHTYISHRADAEFVGYGAEGYAMALRKASNMLSEQP